MKIFDISRTLSDETPPWPGDTQFRFNLNWKMAEGASVNVGALTMSGHSGTHADAPFHFNPSGASIDVVSLDIYFGQAVVVDLTKPFANDCDRARRISVEDLASVASMLERAPRLLLKTNVWKDPNVFPDWVPVIEPDVPAWLGKRGVKLLGVDVPSVDPIEAKELANHHALAAAGIMIVESLNLSDVAPGVYHFAALPLKIANGDAAPVRAILWRD